MLARGMENRIVEDRARRIRVGLKAAEHIADLAGRAQVDGAMILAGEEARHFLHRDPGIARFGRLEARQRRGEPRAAAHAFGVVPRLAAVAAGAAHHHRGPRIDAPQHQNRPLMPA